MAIVDPSPGSSAQVEAGRAQRVDVPPSPAAQGAGIRIEGLRKRYGSGDTAVDALKQVDMTVAAGEVVGLIVTELEYSVAILIQFITDTSTACSP